MNAVARRAKKFRDRVMGGDLDFNVGRVEERGVWWIVALVDHPGRRGAGNPRDPKHVWRCRLGCDPRREKQAERANTTISN